MEKINEILESFGLDEKEIRIYLAVLQLGRTNVSDISKNTGIKRTSLYFILEGLVKKGLVWEEKEEKKSLWIAEPAKDLFERYRERVMEFSKVLPMMESLENKSSNRSRMLFFDCEEGFKKVWRLIFDSGEKEYLILTDPRQLLQFVKKRYITGKIIKEKVKRGIKSRQLLSFSEYAKEVVAKDTEENRVSKILPIDFKVYFTIIIFGSNVAFISPYQENIIFIAESKALAETQRAMFEAIWWSIEDKKKEDMILSS